MNVIVYDPVPQRLQETVNALEGNDVTPVQSVSQLLNIPTYELVILNEDIDPQWVASVIHHCPSTIVVIGMQKKDVSEVRKWTAQIGVHECLNYPLTKDRLARVLTPTRITSAAPYVAATSEAIVQESAPPVQREQPAPVRQANQRFQKPWNQSPIVPEMVPTVEEEPVEKTKGIKIRFTTAKASAKDLVDNLQITEEEEIDPSFNPTRQEIVAITSARGGVGKTTISYNLAVMAAKMGIRTVIIDNDPRGNMVSMSNTKYRYTADQWGELDPEHESEDTVMKLLAKMECGAYLLPSGKEINGMERETLENTIRLLRRSFQLIIIDCEPRFTPATLVAYQHANSLLVVTPDEVSSFTRTIEKVQQIRECGVDSQKIHLVINRVEKDFSKDEEAILTERSSCKVIAKVSNTGDVRKFQKQGKAAVSNPKSAFTKQIKTLLSRVILVPSKASQKTKGGKSGGFLNIFKKSS